MSTEQLERDLWETLRRAQQMLEALQVGQMLKAVEATAVQLPEAERLRFAGEVLLQLAELCGARTNVLLTQWDESNRDPLVPVGFFGAAVPALNAVAPGGVAGGAAGWFGVRSGGSVLQSGAVGEISVRIILGLS